MYVERVDKLSTKLGNRVSGLETVRSSIVGLSGFAFRSLLTVTVLLLAVACGSHHGLLSEVPTLVLLVKLDAVVAPALVAPRPLRALSRVRDEHSALISFIPTATPLLTRAF